MIEEKENIEKDSEEDLIELEFDEESVSYYIVDENDNEIGVCLIEDGEEVEYMYEESDEQVIRTKQQAEALKDNMTKVKSELEDFQGEAQAAAKDLKEVSEELQATLGDLKDSFRIFPKKK